MFSTDSTPDSWCQLYVIVPPNNGYTTPEAVARIDETLTQMFPAFFVQDIHLRLPVRNADGEYEVRCLVATCAGLVKRLLTDRYGLRVVREVRHTEAA